MEDNARARALKAEARERRVNAARFGLPKAKMIAGCITQKKGRVWKQNSLGIELKAGTPKTTAQAQTKSIASSIGLPKIPTENDYEIEFN